MNTLFEPKVNILYDSAGPDVFCAAEGFTPPDSHVISRCRNGKPASTFADVIWDFSEYSPNNPRSKLNFAYWETGTETASRKARSFESRRIVFALIWYKDGAPLSFGTLYNYLSALNATARYAERENLSLAEVLSNVQIFMEFITSSASGRTTQTLSSLLNILRRIDTNHLGLTVINHKAIRHIKDRNREYQNDQKQYAPIPTRLYSHFLSSSRKLLEEWLAVAGDILPLVSMCGSDPRVGRSSTRHQAISKQYGLPPGNFPMLTDLVSERVQAYFGKRGKPITVESLSNIIVNVQYLLKLIILSFTGMRDNEGSSLPYNCLKTIVADGKKHYVIDGTTTKFNNGLEKKARWVTNQQGADAIVAAQEIACSIYKIFGIDPSAADDEPLFVSVRYLRMAGTPLVPDGAKFIQAGFDKKSLPEECFDVIEENDLRELEHIDPHRAWRSEDRFQIGKRWHFTNHQLRRSLALYAQRSGLVSLPSLRRQLQHITEEMSRYYSRGSSYAKNFIGGDKDHFAREWQATQPESAGLSYILNVLLTEDDLFGGHATWAQHRLKSPDGVILIDRELTLKRFKKGELAYKETLIGGCTNTQTCSKVALKWLHTDCLTDNCKNLVCSLPKLDRVIAAQQCLVEAIDKETAEYSVEKEDLAVLISARDKALGLNYV